MRFIVVKFKQSPFLYAKVHKKVGIGPVPEPPVPIEDENELLEKEQEDYIEWGWLEDDADEDKDDSNYSNKFSLFWAWNSLLTFFRYFVTFFVSFYLLLGFITSDYIVYVSGKKRERSDESEQEVEHSSNKKENLEKELGGYGKDFNDIEKALQLDKKLPESQKGFNAEAEQLKKDYPSFFDEDSENTTKEGLEQLKEYLEGEARIAKKNYDEHKTSPDQKRFKQDSSEVVDYGSEPTALTDLDGGE